jgi:hypothetical protein
MQGKNSADTPAFVVSLASSGGNYLISVSDVADGAWSGYMDKTITDVPHYVEVDWKASSGVGANDGTFELIVDGVSQKLTGIDSDTGQVDIVYLGVTWVSGAGPSGTFYLDDFASNNNGSLIGPVGYLASKGENAYALKLDEDGSNLRGDINNTEISASVSNPTEWHHYALTYDGSNQKLYIDGILATTTSKTGSINTNSTNLRIGEYFNGFIDDVHIYNRALSAGEIKALYESYDPALRISDLQKGLVGYWTLDGNAKDSTPYGNNGTIYEASSTVDRKGKANGALSFDGVDDYVEVPNSASFNLTNGFTIEVWIKPQAAQFDSKLVTKVGVSNSFGFYYSPDMFYFYMTTSGSSWRASWLSQAPTLNLWQHLAVTYDNNNTFKFYRDGILIDTDTATWSGSLVNNSDSLNIGGGGWGGSPDIKTIDEVRIYNRALSAGEIKALYESYDPAPRISDLQKGLVGYWTLDGHAKDSTPYGNNGTIYGASSTADRKGQSGKALSFDGTDDHIAGSGQGIKGIINGTVQFWVKPLGRGYCLGNNQEGKVQVSNSSPLIYGIQEIGIYWIDASNEYPGSISLSDNIWTHIVVTWNNAGTGQANGEIKWYSDGIIKTSVSGLTLPVGTSNSFDIGGYSGESPFNGLIDEVRIYNRALSADEVKQLYESYQ